MAEWWRSWHGGPTDAKWLVVARKANVLPGTVSAIAWALFDHASQCEDRGDISTFDVETYAAFSGYEEDQIQTVISVMGEKNVIENGRLCNWEKRQPKREDNSAERAKQWRERKRTQANANEHRTEQNREEKNREEKKKSVKKKEEKTEYAESVFLTEKERGSLVEKHGEFSAAGMIRYLSGYKLASGKKYVSDYHAILNWVADKWEKDHPTPPKKKVAL